MSTEKNKFKIEANPYKPQIKYQHGKSGNDDWFDCSIESLFSKPEFTEAMICNRAFDIIKEVNETYNPGNVGVDLFFEGTKEDKEELSSIIEKYYSNDKINLISEDMYLPSAVDVKNSIENIFKDMKDMFSAYPDNEVTEYINKFSDTVRPTIPICVMGLYSSGKSAFINSLLGVELLPSASDPTTAKTYKISSGDKCEIKFSYENTDVTITFNGDEYIIGRPKELDIVGILDEEIKKKETIEERMYCALSKINNYDMEYNKKNPKAPLWRISDLIEVTLPIKSSVLPFDEFDFIIFDTPGSNSASNVDHTEVLKKAMEGQTNGLPIFVTEPDNMDTTDNKMLIDTINKLGGALDKGNLLVIVNKSDGKSTETLEEKKGKIKELSVSELNPAGIYFVSSVMGLGYKKIINKSFSLKNKKILGNNITIPVPNWINSDYATCFNDMMIKFGNDEEPFQLYKYNIVSQHKLDRYNDMEVSDDDYAYRNSGIHAVEYAINDFSLNYALYNKCRNASQYLSNALAKLNEILGNLSVEQKKLSQQLRENMSVEQKKLLETLEDVCEKKKSEYVKEYSDKLISLVSNEKKTTEAGLSSDLTRFWSDTKGKKNRSFLMENRVNNLLKEKVTGMRDVLTSDSKAFWANKQNDLKKELISIIVGSNDLTREQQEILRDAIIKIESMPDYKLKVWISSKMIVGHFLFVKKLKTEKAKEEFLNCFEIECKTLCIEFSRASTDAFMRLVNEVETQFGNLVTKYNPKLVALSKKLTECNNKINTMQKQEAEINYQQAEIGNLINLEISED